LGAKLQQVVCGKHDPLTSTHVTCIYWETKSLQSNPQPINEEKKNI
jgi:hypothetical protein